MAHQVLEAVMHDDKVWYHALQIPDLEMEWITDLATSFMDGPQTEKMLVLALELAWKRGRSKGGAMLCSKD